MDRNIDSVVIGSGIAAILAAVQLHQRGQKVVVLNPMDDFFLEESELGLDLLSFETETTDLNRRFSNNLPEKVYQELIPDFPGAIEIWKEEDLKKTSRPYQVEEAPWIRSRSRVWVAMNKASVQEKTEELYLQLLDLGWKPQWLEKDSLGRRFPGFSPQNHRDLSGFIGFVGPRLGDVDVARYRNAMLEFAREKLGREEIHSKVHFISLGESGIRVQLSQGQPIQFFTKESIYFCWTPKLERLLRNFFEAHEPRALFELQDKTQLQHWEEWELLSRVPVSPGMIGHFGGVRVWAEGEGSPSSAPWTKVKVMRRAPEAKPLSLSSFEEVSKLVFPFLGWDRFTIRSFRQRFLYRWNHTDPITTDFFSRQRFKVILGCDGPLHWIAKGVRNAL